MILKCSRTSNPKNFQPRVQLLEHFLQQLWPFVSKNAPNNIFLADNCLGLPPKIPQKK